jgi:hypothetical protein
MSDLHFDFDTPVQAFNISDAELAALKWRQSRNWTPVIVAAVVIAGLVVLVIVARHRQQQALQKGEQ